MRYYLSIIFVGENHVGTRQLFKYGFNLPCISNATRLFGLEVPKHVWQMFAKTCRTLKKTFAAHLSWSVYQLVLPMTASLCIHTRRPRCPIWISSHCFEVSSLDFLHFAYFWCQSLTFAEHNDRTPLKWILNLPLFCELHGVFGCRQPVADSKHSGFIHCDPFVKIWN